jgi:4-oxalocrotonate tautomerase
MPVVTVDMFEGRTAEQKRIIVEGITVAFGKIGVTPEQLNIIIRDVQKQNWGYNGKLAADK